MFKNCRLKNYFVLALLFLSLFAFYPALTNTQVYAFGEGDEDSQDNLTPPSEEENNGGGTTTTTTPPGIPTTTLPTGSLGAPISQNGASGNNGKLPSTPFNISHILYLLGGVMVVASQIVLYRHLNHPERKETMFKESLSGE